MEVGGAPSTRSRDALGNVTFTPLEDGDATLRFDGFSRLREVERADTAVITYGYRPDGMLVSRVVVCNTAPGCVASNRTFVYAGLLLLEEYEGTALAARYFYGDGSDIPIAADLFDANLGALRRVYYATDRMGSIVGVMDDAGALIERVSYDPYGRPTIEAADADPPQVSSIERQANGDLLVAFTEAVLPPPSTTAGTTIVNSLASLSGAVTLLRDVSGTMTAVAGTWSYEEAATGFDHGTVLRFVPGEALAAGTAVALSVNAGGLIDSWSNAATAVTLNFNIGAGVLYTGPPQGSTSTPVVERSLVGNGLLFQAHLWDANAGLYLARARVLDPTTGTFLQRDPSGYSDSVNLYAFTKSDPINHRDPRGTATESEIGECIATKGLSRDACIRALTPTIGANTATSLQARREMCFGPNCVAEKTKVEQDVAFAHELERTSELLGDSSLMITSLPGWVGLHAALAAADLFRVQNPQARMLIGMAGAMVGHGLPSSLFEKPPKPAVAADPLAGITEAEIAAAVEAPGRSTLLLEAPAPTGSRYNISGGMMTNEHTVQARSSAATGVGDVATRLRVHTADPTAPESGNSATGNTISILQGSGARRWIPDVGWVQTSVATPDQINLSHIPIHRD